MSGGLAEDYRITGFEGELEDNFLVGFPSHDVIGSGEIGFVTAG